MSSHANTQNNTRCNLQETLILSDHVTWYHIQAREQKPTKKLCWSFLLLKYVHFLYIPATLQYCAKSSWKMRDKSSESLKHLQIYTVVYKVKLFLPYITSQLNVGCLLVHSAKMIPHCLSYVEVWALGRLRPWLIELHCGFFFCCARILLLFYCNSSVFGIIMKNEASVTQMLFGWYCTVH